MTAQFERDGSSSVFCNLAGVLHLIIGPGTILASIFVLALLGPIVALIVFTIGICITAQGIHRFFAPVKQAWRCSACKNTIASPHVRLCPTCAAPLRPYIPPRQSPLPVLLTILAGVIFLTALYLW